MDLTAFTKILRVFLSRWICIEVTNIADESAKKYIETGLMCVYSCQPLSILLFEIIEKIQATRYYTMLIFLYRPTVILNVVYMAGVLHGVRLNTLFWK